MIPKGKLMIIGGHENKGDDPGLNLKIHEKTKPQTHFEILGQLISKIPRAHHIIEIIAAASSIEKEMEDLYINSFKQEGFTHAGIIKVKNKKDGSSKEAIKRIQVAHAIFFTGGDQEKLISLLAKTKLLEAIEKKYYSDKNFIVCGTSAGAMVMPETIITGGLIREALFKGDIKIAEGFGLINNVIVDTHFIKRGRFGRLAHAVTLNPDCLGIGIGEDTALIISEGNEAECIGSGMIILIDGSKMGKTNIKDADYLTPIFIENLVINILVEGNKFMLTERKFV